MKGWLFLLLFILVACTRRHAVPVQATVFIDTFRLSDTDRERVIPVALYQPNRTIRSVAAVPVIFSHGYGQNRGDSYQAYSYLTRSLAQRGYWVISVQHELPGDSLMPTTGLPQVVRRPFWERGVDNLSFVLQEMQKRYPALDWSQLVVAGHSNGGDMAALFAQEYPEQVRKLITLDNRRMTLPRTAAHPKVYTLRSSDQPADSGVLPDKLTAVRLGIVIHSLAATPHNAMDDSGTAVQHQEIVALFLKFLEQ